MKWVSLIGIVFTGLLFGAEVTNNQEFRATWVIDYHWLQPDYSMEQNKQRIREILDKHKQANMTSVFWQVRRFGTVYYPSSYEPWGPQVNFMNPGFDPLQYALEQAHQRGLEFHVWFNTFESRNAFTGSPAHQHPEWVCRDQDGNPMPEEIAWLSPGLPEVRAYLVNVAMEIVNRYDVDGLHLDFVRWNEYTSSQKLSGGANFTISDNVPSGIIAPEIETRLNEVQSGRYLYDYQHPYANGVPDGFATWEDYWRWCVTEFVRTLHDSIQAVKPWVRLSVAALGRYNWGSWQGYGSVYQDAALWLNERFIDQIAGMHYHWNNGADMYNILEGGCPNCWSQYIQPAIQLGQLYTVGIFSDNLESQNLFYRHQSIIDTVRSIDWVNGFQFFSYESWENQRYWDKATRLFFPTKTKIRATGLVDSIPPLAPTLNLIKLDSLHYQITISPSGASPAPGWFAIYRSIDDTLDVNSDEIIEIRFDSTTFSYIDAFTGLQDYNGKYWYFATALDRYWNESAISNALVSDSIPSFAPTVVETVPAEGDSIPVNGSIKIVFSKTMNISTFVGGFTLNPAIEIKEVKWSPDHKAATIEFRQNLPFNTAFELTLLPTITDVNGRALDGNGDGIEGDPFILHFKSYRQDVTPPIVINSYPPLDGSEQNFALDDIITLVFDEQVNPNTIGSEKIQLTADSDTLEFKWLHTIHNNRYSVLSIQPTPALQQNQFYTLVIDSGIADTAGNVTMDPISLSFKTSRYAYNEEEVIENFTVPGDWWQPNGSGSTVGIVVSGTKWGISKTVVLPADRPKRAAFLTYQWDTEAQDWLIREYLAGGAPYNVTFDTSYVLQCYVYGDGSGNKLRFALDDNVPRTSASNHEVSKWIPIDWIGWRLIEWDLGDPSMVGQWIGDGTLDGTLRFDSFQLTHEPGAATSGTLYFDNLRLVKKTLVGIADNAVPLPTTLVLMPNYPNPFNPTTTFRFAVPGPGKVKIVIYDMLGRVVDVAFEGHVTAGMHAIQYDASQLASGIYIYRLISPFGEISRRMLLLK